MVLAGAQQSFRSAVTLFKEAGIPAALVMELIGHDNVQMSEHYTPCPPGSDEEGG